jgi:hypothetical protein
VKIRWNGAYLADFDSPASDVRVNGTRVVEAVDMLFAATKRIRARGNASVELSFAVKRTFTTIREAQVYQLTQWGLLPQTGLCEIVCGGPGEATESVWMADAVMVASPSAAALGTQVQVRYSILAPAAAADVPGTYFEWSDDEMIQRGKEPIALGAETVDVEFGTAFGAAPIVTVTLAKPSGGSNIFATLRDDLVTASGFTAELSGPTPDANHKLTWTALSTV